MNLKIYYKNLSSRIASKWTILAIDICLIMISMLLACILQLGVSSIIYKIQRERLAQRMNDKEEY